MAGNGFMVSFIFFNFTSDGLFKKINFATHEVGKLRTCKTCTLLTLQVLRFMQKLLPCSFTNHEYKI